jgi:hypothetical protein
LSKPRERAALELLKYLWPIHFPIGRAYNDAQATLCFRDAHTMADEWVRVSELQPADLAALGMPKAPAADAVVEEEAK